MLAASVHYPIRGAVTFKGPVGVNVASDALANLASLRRHRRRAGHRRRGLWRRLLDHAGAQPRLRDEVAVLAARPAPEPAVDRQGGGATGSNLSEASQHAGDADGADPLLPRDRLVRDARQPPAAAQRARDALSTPRSDFSRVVLPPMSYAHEQDKVNNRWPAAQKFIVEQKLNERFGPADGAGRHRPAGRHVQWRHPRAAAARPRRHLWRNRRSRSMC